jgi:hypothetical protein
MLKVAAHDANENAESLHVALSTIQQYWQDVRE